MSIDAFFMPGHHARQLINVITGHPSTTPATCAHYIHSPEGNMESQGGLAAARLHAQDGLSKFSSKLISF